MTNHRPHLRRSAVRFAAAALAALATTGAAPLLTAPAGAQTPTTTTPTTTPTTPTTTPTAPAIPPLCFPVEGLSYFGSPPATSLATTYWSDTFGAARSGHAHEGEDIMSVRGVKMRHLLAAVSGTVAQVLYNNASGNRIVIRGDDGWFYVYIHVNNDTPGTDDAKATQAQVFAPGIAEGVRVTAGQFIAYLGDSGNAESAGAHNHFEVRRPLTAGNPNTTYAWSSATAVNSTAALRDAMAHPERCGAPSTRFAPFSGVAELVDRQYRDFTGAAPTTAQRNAAIDLLNADRQTPAAFISSLVSAPAYADRVGPIARLYRAYFLRTPENDGLQYWVTQYRAGRSLTWIADYFAQSPEFVSRYGNLTDPEFVNQIYRNLLGRDGEPGGVAFWNEKLARRQMNRGQVMVEFSESPENKSKVASWVQVVLVYAAMYQRIPATGDLQAAVDQRAAKSSDDDLVTSLLASSEYAGRVAALRTP